MNTPNRYHLWAAIECHAFSIAEAVLKFSAEEDGMWVQWQDYARIKADAQVILKHLEEASADCARLKAEVERLTAEKDQAECDYDNCQKRKVSIDNHRFYLFNENKNLKAEVERLRKDTSMMLSVYFKHSERLRKAGDAMAVMVGHIEVTGDAHRMMLELSKEWEEAKEGKPSV